MDQLRTQLILRVDRKASPLHKAVQAVHSRAMLFSPSHCYYSRNSICHTGVRALLRKRFHYIPGNARFPVLYRAVDLRICTKERVIAQLFRVLLDYLEKTLRRCLPADFSFSYSSRYCLVP